MLTDKPVNGDSGLLFEEWGGERESIRFYGFPEEYDFGDVAGAIKTALGYNWILVKETWTDEGLAKHNEKQCKVLMKSNRKWTDPIRIEEIISRLKRSSAVIERWFNKVEKKEAGSEKWKVSLKGLKPENRLMIVGGEIGFRIRNIYIRITKDGKPALEQFNQFAEWSVSMSQRRIRQLLDMSRSEFEREFKKMPKRKNSPQLWQLRLDLLPQYKRDKIVSPPKIKR